jgi:hypothetical protein
VKKSVDGIGGASRCHVAFLCSIEGGGGHHA